MLEKLGTERNLLKSVKQSSDITATLKDKNGFLTHALKGKLEGKSPRGRPRTTWMSNIAKWTGKTNHNCTQMDVDRDLWSIIVSRPLEKDIPCLIERGALTNANFDIHY